MPICRECHGAGQVDVKIEVMTRCPDCDATKLLPDGAECKRCNQWGEIGTGEFQVEKQLCKTCWGSGKVSEGSITVWFLVRAVPATLLLLGGGIVLIWAAWTFLNVPWLTAGLTVLTFGVWGSVIFYYVSQMPTIGEISATNWFLMRAVPTTVAAMPIGAAVVWLTWLYLHNPAVTTILALAAFMVWGMLMFYFITYLPE